MAIDLKNLVVKHMSDMIAAYSLQLIEVEENEILLKSKGYALEIIADKDGASIIYFDTSSSPPIGYNIFLFLNRFRRDALSFSSSEPGATNYSEFIERELKSLAQHIRSGGNDILTGTKDWTKKYYWPIICANNKIASFI